jgi:transposase
MLQINFTEEEIRTLHYERFHYPDPKVQKKFEVLWLKSQRLSHETIAQLSGVCARTVQRYLLEYLEGGLERLQQNHYRGSPSELNQHTETLKDYFTHHPPSTVAHAQKAIEELTGLRRSLTQVRAFLKRLGLKRRKVGSAPGKADDPDKQQEQREFVKTKLNPRLDEAEQGQRKIFLSTPVISYLVPFCAICGALLVSFCARLRDENGTMFWAPWITSPSSC